MWLIDSSGAGWASVFGFVVASVVLPAPAAAQVKQTDALNTPLPQPVSQAEADLINNSWAWNANTMVSRDPAGTNLNPPIRYGDYYAPPTFPQFVTGDAINLSGLFKWRKEAIDPVLDAKIAPGYFSTKCGVTVELLLMGGNCQAQLGWYNVTDPTSKIPPTAAEIYPIFSGKPLDQLKCVEADGTQRKTDGFCPLAWDNRHPYDLSIKRWTPKLFSSGDITKDLTHYKGGYVGFAMIGDPAHCAQNKFSMYEHNQHNASGVPWVTTLIYQSTVDATGFYLAFEDLPMSPADWKKDNSGYPGADGDFNDLVFYVSGLTCAGGNQACDTGKFGACAVGRTDCAVNGQSPACRPVLQARAETCDNVDNDCDGSIDNGAGLCPDSNAPNCFHGVCVASCTNGAFPCPLGSSCDPSGKCVDPTCDALSCGPGTSCRDGACTDPCVGVLCPHGSQCELGQCVNPCAEVTCPSERVCDKGLCVAKCACNGCSAGLTCASDGRCVDLACAGTVCATGAVCQLGACVDPCTGVVCPGGGVCSLGTCSSPHGSGGSGGNGGSGGSGGSGGRGGLSFGGTSAAGMPTGGMAASASAGAAQGGVANVAGADDAGNNNQAGTVDAGGNGNAAGNSHAAGGVDTAGGMNSRAGASAANGAGVGSPASEPSNSSCGCAVPGQGTSSRALPVLGLILGAALRRRRRRSITGA